MGQWEGGDEAAREAQAPCCNSPEGVDLGGESLWGETPPGAFHRNRVRRLRQLHSEAPGGGGAEPYDALWRVLGECFDQAATGKGAERHTDGSEPFTEQFICEGQREFGVGGGLFQAVKKIKEANRMIARGERDRGIHEFRGAINYLAAVIIVLQEGANDASPNR